LSASQNIEMGGTRECDESITNYSEYIAL